MDLRSLILSALPYDAILTTSDALEDVSLIERCSSLVDSQRVAGVDSDLLVLEACGLALADFEKQRKKQLDTNSGTTLDNFSQSSPYISSKVAKVTSREAGSASATSLAGRLVQLLARH